MTPFPNTPREMADLLGLSFDFSREGSPAIVGASGKRHYYAHGRDGQQLEITDVLHRLHLIRAASGRKAPPDALPSYQSELTQAGEQLVIPGCARIATPATRQLSLWDAAP